MHSHSSYYGYEGRQMAATVTAQTSYHERPVFSKYLFGAYLSRLVPIPHLICVCLDRLSR